MFTCGRLPPAAAIQRRDRAQTLVLEPLDELREPRDVSFCFRGRQLLDRRLEFVEHIEHVFDTTTRV
jgi:hypothetical protein